MFVLCYNTKHFIIRYWTNYILAQAYICVAFHEYISTDLAFIMARRFFELLACYQILARLITLFCMVGFLNYLPEILIFKSRCVAVKMHVGRLKGQHDTAHVNFVPKL